MRQRRRLARMIALIAACSIGAAYGDDSPEAIKNARKRFQEGVAAMDAKKYEEARVAFQQAYALKPHPSVLRNLGQAELRTGHWVEAARHLSSFLHETSFGTAEERDGAKQALAEAETRVGKIVVEADVNGAEIAIDGVIVGRTPTQGEPLYGEPGPRALRLRKDGYDDYESPQLLEAGRNTEVKVTMRRTGAETADTAKAVPPPRVQPAVASAPPPAAEHGIAEPSRASPAIVIAGSTVAVLGIAAGIGFRVSAGSKTNDRDVIYAGLAGVSPCGRGTPFADACAQARELDSDSVHQRNLSTAGFVVAGASAAATFAYVLWPRDSARGAGTVQVIPTLSKNGAAMAVRSTF